MNIRELQDEIIRLKKEKDFCILAHVYENREIVEIADYIGDSFGLSQQAAKAPQKNVIMCGVRFMAETVKLLSPEKHVYLSNSEAGCPMAEQLSVEKLREMKKQLPDHKVVAYINTTSELKTECDVCVTSASALDILRKMDDDKILFIPDINLGSYVKSRLPEKQFELYKGGCPVHAMMTREDVEKAKALLAEAGYPDGFTASIMVYGDANNKIGQLVQSDFSKIGVELNVELTEFGAMLEYLNLGEHDMYTLSYGAAGNPDSTFSNVYHGSSSAASGNRSYYANPEVDKLIDEARVTMEWEKREPVYKKMQELIMQDAPIIPLYSEQKYYAMNANMEGYVISKNAKHDFYNAYIVEK